MIDRRFIGHTLPAFDVRVEAGRLRFFAKATGQTDPLYVDYLKPAYYARNPNMVRTRGLYDLIPGPQRTDRSLTIKFSRLFDLR